jgi:hypothetical protein
MQQIARVAVTLFAAVATYFFLFWMVGAVLWSSGLALSAGLFRSAGIGAAVTGGIGFCLGFFGPILLTPEANQGPLLGLFITGPLGAVLGGLGGAVHWLVRGRKAVA